MLRPPRLNRWRDLPEGTGLLLLAQRIEELLFDYTLDTYKAPALNTFTRCSELLTTIADVRSGLIRSKTLAPMVEELATSISTDTAAKVVTRPHAQGFADVAWWSLSSPAKLETQAQMLRSFLWKRAYEKELIAQLRLAVIAGKQKESISQLAGSLVVEWIRKGYSRDFIFMKTRTHFFGYGQGSIRDFAAAFDDFVGVFHGKKQQFDVCVRVHKSVSELSKIISTEIAQIGNEAPKPRAGKAKELAFLAKPHDGVFVTLSSIDAFDARSARDQALQLLTTIATVAGYHVHRTPFSFEREALVWQEKHPVVLQPPTSPIRKHSECAIGDLPGRFMRTLGTLHPTRIGNEAWSRITSALGLHASALGSDDATVQLTTLWSAIEAIVPSPLDESRIQTVSDTLGPVLSLNYARKLLEDLHSSLLRCAAKEYSDACQTGGWNEPSLLACAAIVAIPQNEPLRDIIYGGLAENPLMRHRLYSAKRQFESATTTRDTILAHHQRVLWHLRRIYRTRNMIVHAGRTHQFIETLVENVHAYLHQVINALEEQYSSAAFPSSLDSAFMALRMQHERHLRYLKEHRVEATSTANLRQILFGDDLVN